KWVRGIARNTVRQELRRRGRESERMKAYAILCEKQFDRMEQDEPARQERLKSLQDCVMKLDKTARELIRMRYMASESYAGIADALGQARGAIRTRLFRIREQLHRCLEAKGVWP
ncbi:MAG: RNA polymerase sigma factor, partial [Verrucomicrobiota bacterium]